MANDGKFLNLTSGAPTQEQAIATSAGAADANKIPRLDATGKFDPTLLPAGGGTVETRTMQASEALAAGDLVNIWNSGGPRMRKADATSPGKEAHGFVLAAVASGASGTLYPEEAVITGLAGLTPGARQFLTTVAGQRSEVCPTGSGVLAQIIGVALSTTEILFRPETSIPQA